MNLSCYMSTPTILTSVDQPEYNHIIINLLIIIMTPLSRRSVAHVLGSSNNFIERIRLLKLTVAQPVKDVHVLYETQRIIKPTVSAGGRDNVVGTATRSRAEQWVHDFRNRPVPPPRPLNLPYNGHRIPFPEVKRPGSCADHPHLLALGLGMGTAVTIPPVRACLECNGTVFAFTFVVSAVTNV